MGGREEEATREEEASDWSAISRCGSAGSRGGAPPAITERRRVTQLDEFRTEHDVLSTLRRTG